MFNGNVNLIKSLESMLKSELVKEDSDSKYNNVSGMLRKT